LFYLGHGLVSRLGALRSLHAQLHDVHVPVLKIDALGTPRERLAAYLAQLLEDLLTDPLVEEFSPHVLNNLVNNCLVELLCSCVHLLNYSLILLFIAFHPFILGVLGFWGFGEIGRAHV